MVTNPGRSRRWREALDSRDLAKMNLQIPPDVVDRDKIPGLAGTRQDETGQASHPSAGPHTGQPHPGLDEARLRQQAIGVKLRQMFDAVVNEPVPDVFLDILRKADQAADGDDR